MRARLKKIQREYLWGGGALEKRLHLVNWKIVCAKKKERDLGIRSPVALNKALLRKWSWRFSKEKESLWKQVIIGEFGLEGRGVVFERSERRLWCGGVENH